MTDRSNNASDGMSFYYQNHKLSEAQTAELQRQLQVALVKDGGDPDIVEFITVMVHNQKNIPYIENDLVECGVRSESIPAVLDCIRNLQGDEPEADTDKKSTEGNALSLAGALSAGRERKSERKQQGKETEKKQQIKQTDKKQTREKRAFDRLTKGKDSGRSSETRRHQDHEKNEEPSRNRRGRGRDDNRGPDTNRGRHGDNRARDGNRDANRGRDSNRGRIDARNGGRMDGRNRSGRDGPRRFADRRGDRHDDYERRQSDRNYTPDRRFRNEGPARDDRSRRNDDRRSMDGPNDQFGYRGNNRGGGGRGRDGPRDFGRGGQRGGRGFPPRGIDGGRGFLARSDEGRGSPLRNPGRLAGRGRPREGDDSEERRTKVARKDDGGMQSYQQDADADGSGYDYGQSYGSYRGGYHGRGRRGRGGRYHPSPLVTQHGGRGRFPAYEDVKTMMAAKQWVRKKEDTSGEAKAEES